tara:strand:+ start:55 stop:234 length:180 start_codon:yes stop_codon:yes gene_type:complete
MIINIKINKIANQKSWELKVSGFNCGIPPFSSAAKSLNEKKQKIKDIIIFAIILLENKQ